MSVENRILIEEQRAIVKNLVRSLCTPGGCRVLSRADCSRGELIDVEDGGERLPFCFADKRKRALLKEGAEGIAKRDGLDPKIVIPILKFLATVPVTTKEELKAWRSRQPKLTLRQILEENTQNIENEKSRP